MIERINDLVRSIDRRLLSSFFSKYALKRANQLAVRTFGKDCSYFSTVYRYDTSADRENLLSRLCDKYGSDKGSLGIPERPYAWEPHTYAHQYSQLFSDRRGEIQTVLEFGIGTNDPGIPSSMGPDGKPGASLRVWRDFFPNAQIFGADLDRKCLFEEERIKTYFVDQTQRETFGDLWSEIGDIKFDVIIDDGLHTPAAAKTTYEMAREQLVPGGFCIVEDLSIAQLCEMKKFLLGATFELRLMANSNPGGKRNNLLIIYG